MEEVGDENEENNDIKSSVAPPTKRRKKHGNRSKRVGIPCNDAKTKRPEDGMDGMLSLGVPATDYKFPKNLCSLIDGMVDYSTIEEYRVLLNRFHAGGYLSNPPFALELSSLFIRCLDTVKGSAPVWESKRGFVGSVRLFHLQLIAALGWVYAYQYACPLPTNRTKLQSLSQLRYGTSAHRFNKAMELIQLLLASAKLTLNISLEEVLTAKVGCWFTNRIAQVKKGVWGNDALKKRIGSGHCNAVMDGIYLPFYLAFRAIHPYCPRVFPKESVRVSQKELLAMMSEPLLYDRKDAGYNCVKLFPRSLANNKNYNLWFFYDNQQPEPMAITKLGS